MSKNAKDNTAALALALAVTTAAPAALAGGDHGGPQPISAGGGNATNTTVVDAGGGAGGAGGNATGGNATGGNATGGNATGGDSRNINDISNIANGGGGGAGGAGGAGGQGGAGGSVAGSGNSDVKVDPTITTNPTSTSGAATNGTVNYADNSRTTIKHKVGVTTPGVNAQGECKDGWVAGVGGDWGASFGKVNVNTKCLDKVHQHDLDVKILDKGAEGALYVIKKDSLRSNKNAEAFNTVGEASFKASQGKGPHQPTLGELWQSARPSHVEPQPKQTTIEYRGHAAPAPSFGGDR